jgi:ABC transporter substrate binding protein
MPVCATGVDVAFPRSGTARWTVERLSPEPSVQAAMAATKSIPIAMAPAGDALGTRLVDNLARPSGNVTGFRYCWLRDGPLRDDSASQPMPIWLSRIPLERKIERPAGDGPHTARD